MCIPYHHFLNCAEDLKVPINHLLEEIAKDENLHGII